MASWLAAGLNGSFTLPDFHFLSLLSGFHCFHVSLYILGVY
jgi:hypothetical protein